MRYVILYTAQSILFANGELHRMTIAGVNSARLKWSLGEPASELPSGDRDKISF